MWRLTVLLIFWQCRKQSYNQEMSQDFWIYRRFVGKALSSSISQGYFWVATKIFYHSLWTVNLCRSVYKCLKCPDTPNRHQRSSGYRADCCVASLCLRLGQFIHLSHIGINMEDSSQQPTSTFPLCCVEAVCILSSKKGNRRNIEP